MAITFQLVDSAARVPTDVAIESMARLRLTANGPERLPLFETVRGKYIEVMKGVNRRTRAPVALAFDETGKRVDETRLLKQLEKKRAAKLGKLHEGLQQRLRTARPEERLSVAVWANGVDEIDPNEKRGLERVSEEPRMPRAAAQRSETVVRLARAVGEIADELGAVEIRFDEAAPVVFARMHKRSIQQLAKRKEVAGIFLYDPEGIDDLKDSIAIANSDDVHTAGPKGAGVKVAVWEDGPTSTTNLVIEARYDSTPSTSDHSENVHAIIKNKESNKPHGHAPECKLHSANSKDLAALSWAVKDRGCTVINQSFHRSSEPGSDSLSFDDIYKDWLILNWPYPTICQAGGNYWNGDPDGISPPSDEFVNHKGFNSIAVANHDDSASAMSSSSVFRNPASSHGDRELPEVAANGTSVTADGITMTGTSQASPAAVGIAALLQSTSATLKAWPEGCRAILFAGAIEERCRRDLVAGRGRRRRRIGRERRGECVRELSDRSEPSLAQRVSNSARLGRRHAGLERLRLEGLSKFAYRIQVPRFWFGPRHVKVALAWDSKVSTISFLGITIPISSQLKLDLDLKIFDKNGTQVGYSGSWDNSYEVAEFDAIPGETYEIRIRRGPEPTGPGTASPGR